jgi:hypothetical protein
VLLKILQRDYPNNLTQLKLVKCVETHSKHLIEQLLNFLNDEVCNLTSLALVGVNLSELGVNIISKLIRSTALLYELDISWNRLKAVAFKDFLIELGKNRTLRIVNISWNNLID